MKGSLPLKKIFKGLDFNPVKPSLLLVMLVALLAGCTSEEPGYVIIIDDDPVSVSVSGNPEVRIIDLDGNILTIDEHIGAITALTYTHQLVHDGTAFKADTVDEVLADEALIILVFKTMSSPKVAHMFVEFTTLVGGNLKVWEGVTWTTGTGGLVPIINRKRETTMVSSGLLEDLTATPAFTATNNILEKVAGLNTAGATNIHHLYAWGKKEKILAGDARDTEGFILKPDTQYAIVFTAGGAANKAQVILNWLEEIH